MWHKGSGQHDQHGQHGPMPLSRCLCSRGSQLGTGYIPVALLLCRASRYERRERKRRWVRCIRMMETRERGREAERAGRDDNDVKWRGITVEEGAQGETWAGMHVRLALLRALCRACTSTPKAPLPHHMHTTSVSSASRTSQKSAEGERKGDLGRLRTRYAAVRAYQQRKEQAVAFA